MANWAKTSVGLITFAFITLVLFIVLSSPIATIFDMIDDEAEDMNVSADVSPIISTFRTVFGMMFVLSMIGLGVWFFLGSHEEEYEQTVDERYRRGW